LENSPGCKPWVADYKNIEAPKGDTIARLCRPFGAWCSLRRVPRACPGLLFNAPLGRRQDTLLGLYAPNLSLTATLPLTTEGVGGLPPLAARSTRARGRPELLPDSGVAGRVPTVVVAETAETAVEGGLFAGAAGSVHCPAGPDAAACHPSPAGARPRSTA